MSAVRLVVSGLALAGLLAASAALAAETRPVDRSSTLHPKVHAPPPSKPAGRSNNGSAWSRTPDGRMLYRDGDTSVVVSGSVSAGFAAGARH